MEFRFTTETTKVVLGSWLDCNKSVRGSKRTMRISSSSTRLSKMDHKKLVVEAFSRVK